ncbi:NAD(P)H-binding protein [Arthrobacter sp. zg-Y826]|uniref:SDR family oxidoreductase n=1 Tax=Arthrobacter jinronghuae TaxID=2964609 RepID=UPI002104E549|nr:NAD(P)H-binding protein [Arthrobacter jinronghuae]MCQ1956496.1 NAD(P)H-binding protein [Arthrobacter jinronghuae]
MRILVTGATGRIGRRLVDELLQDGHEVIALTRNPQAAAFRDGVSVTVGDLTDAGSLANAFEDVDAAYLITFGGGADLANGSEIVSLAERAGVRRITVQGGWEETSVEKALRESAISWSLLQPVEFMDNTLEWAEEIRSRGTVSLLADYPSAMIHEADIAAVAARTLTEEGHGGHAYALTGPEALTPRERTRILSEATGRDLRFVPLTESQERERLRGYGYEPEYVEFGIALATNPPDAAGKVLLTVQHITGLPGRTFAQWAAENSHVFSAPPG